MSGDWDKEKLAVLMTDLDAADFDVSLTGFDAAEIDDLFKDTLRDGVEDDDFDVDEELQNPPITMQGDVWVLGRHRLVCGDSTKKETFDKLMENKKANLVVTDPPYNVDYEGSAGKIKNDNMNNDTFYQFLLDAFTNTEDALAKDGSIYVFHADTEGLNFRRAFEEAGFYLSGTLVFGRNNRLYLVAHLISGNTNRYYLVGKRRVGTVGIQIGNNRPFGNLINQNEMPIIQR